MTQPATVKKRIPPKAFAQHARAQFERTVQLTQKAIVKLQAQGQSVTLSALAQATQALDEKGKGLEPNTILRNPEAARLFREQSLSYQARQRQARKAKRSHARIPADVRATYQGLRPSDLIRMVEELKQQHEELKTQRDQLQTQRDEAHRMRDQALQQNARQLAMLTQVGNQRDGPKR